MIRRRRLPVLLLLAAGCYHYAPATESAAVPGTHLRLALTPDGSDRMAAVLGAGTTVIEGRILAISDTTFQLAVSETRREGVARVVWTGETVSLPRSAIARVEGRSLRAGRTAALIGGGAAAATALVFAVVKAVGSGSGGGDGPPVTTP